MKSRLTGQNPLPNAVRAMSTNVHNSLKNLVGAPGFEPGASCAQGRRLASNKLYRFHSHSGYTWIFKHFGVCVDVSWCGRMVLGALQKPLHLTREWAASRPGKRTTLVGFRQPN